MLLRRRLAYCLAVLLLGAPDAALAQAQATAPPAARYAVFTIAGVPVDVTAANASAARDQALAEGERRAFQMLLERLTLATDRGRLPRVGAAQLTDLVQGFDVADERRSGVRYLANYTFHFRPEGVRQLLNQAGIGFAETPSKPLVVLPVLHDGERNVLWEDPNPWRDAWGRAKIPPGLVPLVLPLGELDDVAAIDADAAARGDDARLQAISQRYDGDDVLVTAATLRSGMARGINVAATRFVPGTTGSRQSWTVPLTANAGESDADLMARAIADTMARVEEAWKVANILDVRQSGTLLVRVPAGALKDWVAVRDRLAGIPAVRSSQLVSLDRNGAQVEIHYVGDPAQLRLALTQRDLELSGSDPDWILRQRGGAGAPR